MSLMVKWKRKAATLTTTINHELLSNAKNNRQLITWRKISPHITGKKNEAFPLREQIIFSTKFPLKFNCFNFKFVRVINWPSWIFYFIFHLMSNKKILLTHKKKVQRRNGMVVVSQHIIKKKKKKTATWNRARAMSQHTFNLYLLYV